MATDVSATPPTGFAESEHVKILFPVGGGYDIPSGFYYYDKKGKAWLNGGASAYWALGGEPNSHKSAQVRHVSNTMADRLGQVGINTPNLTYDSENTSDDLHNRASLKRMPYLSKHDPMISGFWKTVSKKQAWLCEFYEIYKNWVKELGITFKRRKNKCRTIFLDRRGKTIHEVNPPIQLVVDSISEGESKSTGEIQQNSQLGAKEGKMVFAYAGLDKTRFLSSVSTLGSTVNSYVFLTSHYGEDNAIQIGFNQGPPKKKLADMPVGMKFKGVPKNFYYLLINIWMTRTGIILSNKADYKKTMYPLNRATERSGDLHSILTTLVRSKSSESGGSINVISSQNEGVLASLTEYHGCKLDGYYSMGGSPASHYSYFLPDVTMRRTTVRKKLDENPLLRRAILLGHEMLQIFTLRKYDDEKQVCLPEQLYQDLIDIGYDWGKILTSRSWHTLNNHLHPVPSLSTMDILNFRIGRYHEDMYLQDKVKAPNKKVIAEILKCRTYPTD